MLLAARRGHRLLVRLASTRAYSPASSSGQGAAASPNSTADTASDEYVLIQTRSRKVVQFKVQGTPSQGFSFNHSLQSIDAVRPVWDDNDKPGVLRSLSRRTSRVFKSVLLPAGYPHTVGDGYWGYVAWQAVSNFAIAANTVLSSTFMLYAVGLGAGAIPTAGALNWVLKDGLGQLGTLIFGKTIAHNFDIHSKSWYFLSNLMLKLATGVEIFTIILPQHFLVLGGVANSLKGLAWMANGSTRSVFNLSFARDNNIADITAKGTSQYICASMFGTVAGATLCTWVGQDSVTAALCYVTLTAITLYSAYATVKTIPLATLNSTRLQLLCESYLGSISAAAASRHLHRRAMMASAYGQPSSLPMREEPTLLQGSITAQQAGQQRLGFMGSGNTQAGFGIDPAFAATEYEKAYDEYLDAPLPGPVILAAEDPPLPFLMGDQRLLNPAIIVGEELERMLDDTGPELVVVLISTYRLSRAVVLPRGPAVHILLHQGATSRDICQAYLQACLLRRRMRAGSMVGLAAAEHAAEVDQAQRDAEAHRALLQEAAALQQASSSSSASVQAEPDIVQQEGLVVDGSAASAATSTSTATGSEVKPVPEASLGAAAHDQSSGEHDLSDLMCVVKGTSSRALADLRIVLQDTLQTAERLTSPFMRSLEAAGWKLDKVVVEPEKRRARW